MGYPFVIRLTVLVLFVDIYDVFIFLFVRLCDIKADLALE